MKIYFDANGMCAGDGYLPPKTTADKIIFDLPANYDGQWFDYGITGDKQLAYLPKSANTKWWVLQRPGPPGSGGFYIGPRVIDVGQDRMPVDTDGGVWRQITAPYAGIEKAVHNAAPIEDYRAYISTLIRGEGLRRLRAIGRPYSSAERETWSKQVDEAYRWLDNRDAKVPLITAAAAARQMALEAYVNKIIEHDTTYSTAMGVILGREQYLLDQIATAKTVADVDAVHRLGWKISTP